jgi:hypothetical protein
MGAKAHDVDIRHSGGKIARKLEKGVGLGAKRPDQRVYQKDDGDQ